MMPVYLLAILFATSNAELMRFVEKVAKCSETFAIAEARQECKPDEAIQCLKESADECDINNSTHASAMEQVREMEQLFADICETGSDMNSAFQKHKGCLFGTQLPLSNKQCFEKLIEAVLGYKKTGNTEKDEKAGFKIACKYLDDANKCESANAKEVCGEAAQGFRRKINEPSIKLMKMACNSSPALFGPFWTILLQAAVILMSLQYFGLKE